MEAIPVPDIQKEVLEKALGEMVGTLSLPVPLYSAIKQKGKPLYKYARMGKEVEVPIKEMTVQRVSFRGVTRAGECLDVSVVFDVASGTYIRSLAEEFGKRLGYPATLAALRRTRVGEWRVEEAERIEHLVKTRR
jgi:tRNA pseudouridine55 synthase